MRVRRGSKPEKPMVPACGRTIRSAKTTLPNSPGASCSFSGLKVLPSIFVASRAGSKKSSGQDFIVGTLDRRFDKIERAAKMIER